MLTLKFGVDLRLYDWLLFTHRETTISSVINDISSVGITKTSFLQRDREKMRTTSNGGLKIIASCFLLKLTTYFGCKSRPVSKDVFDIIVLPQPIGIYSTSHPVRMGWFLKLAKVILAHLQTSRTISLSLGCAARTLALADFILHIHRTYNQRDQRPT